MRIRKAPKTEMVYLLLKEKIVRGEFSGGVLPMEPELAEELQISRKTLRGALAKLTLENFIVRIKGQGTFVNRPEEMPKRILVLIRDEEDITNPDRYIIPGIRQEADAMNLAVDTCTCLSLTSTPADLTINGIKQKNYSGILCMASNFSGDEPLLDVLKRTGLPVLLPHGTPLDAGRTGFTVMGSDYRQIVRDGLQYLIDLGHRRIAYLAYREHRIDKESYFRLLEELGLDCEQELYMDIPYHNDRSRITANIAEHFERFTRKPTAVFCFSDFFAICLYDHLQKKNIRIPEDIAVLSIGGMIGCDFLFPPLSAIDFGCAEIGRLAVRTLMEIAMNGKTEENYTVTPHYLTERKSTRIINPKEN